MQTGYAREEERMRSRRNGFTAAIITAACLLGLTACAGTDTTEEKYTSPNFNTEVVTEAGKPGATESTEDPDVVPSELSTGEPVKTSDLETDVSTNTTIAGSYENGDYYNPFIGLAIKSDSSWRLYGAAEVAEVTGLTEDEVNDLWYGVVSPYSVKTMTCAIAYKKSTGSNLIVSYINPKLYYMQNMSAREYLELSAREYPDVIVQNMDYLGQTFASATFPEIEGDGRRIQFAIRKSDLIILLTYTLQGDDTIDDAADHVTRLLVE